MDKRDITAVILSGGQSRRMAGQDKGLIQLNQKALIQHVIDALEGEVATILINANRHQTQYQTLTQKNIISDDLDGFQGPLAGFAKAMQVATTPYILVLPCDCPMIDKTIVSILKQTLIREQTDICVADDGNRLQPTFTLLKTSLLESLLSFLKQGGRKIDLWYAQHSFARADCSEHLHFFTNLNRPIDYAKLTQATRIKTVPVLGFSAFSGTGKTTLITQLIKQLSQQKVRVGFVKHAHHDFAIDHPGKDSYEVYEAGASAVLISSAKRFAHINRYPSPTDELGLFPLLNTLGLANLDLIIVEGFKNEKICKIELQRRELNKPALFTDDAHIIAVATNDTQIQCNRVVLDINRLDEIVAFVCAYAKLNPAENVIPACL